MDRDSFVLRPGRPTLAEGLVFARYLDEAAEGFIRIMLGRKFAQIVAEAYTQPQNEYSFQNVTFVESGGRIVGMTSGFTAETRRNFSDEPVKKAVGIPAVRMRAMRILFAPVLRILKTIPDHDFYLLAIAVDPDARGRGVGSALMGHAEEQALASGSGRLSLDVSVKNSGARKLYERRGMAVVSEWPGLRFTPSVFVRMTKVLARPPV